MAKVELEADRLSGRTAKFLAGASIVALALTAAEPALAQPAAPAATAQPAGESPTAPDQAAPEGTTGKNAIIVTGIRASLRSARDRKKNAEQMVDSITAQDIGALPDRSVSEALQRIPGVTLQRTNEARDPARLSAEGGGIFIRGLSWVRSEFNGRDTFSANNGRQLGFEDVPADLLAGVDVYKNPSADLIEGAIGGLVNLRTRKPFDQSGQLFAASVDVNYADLRKKAFWSGNALYSNHWHTNIGELGFLVAASINNIGNRTDEMQTGAYNKQTVGGTDYYFPASLGIRRIDWTQRRTAFDGSIQWKPADNFTLTLEGIYARAKSHDLENVVGIDATMPAPGTAGVSYTFDDQNNVLTGSIPAGTSGFGLIDLADARYGRRTDTTKDLSANARWQVTSRFGLSADIQHVVSSMDLLSNTAFVQLGTPLDVNFDLTGKNPWINFSSSTDAQLQQSNYWWAANMDHFEHNDASEWAYRADADYDFGDGGFLKSFRFGARATDRNAVSRATNWNWGLLSAQLWGAGPAVFLNETGGTGFAPAGPNPNLPNDSYLFGFNNFFRGNVPAPGGFWVPTPDLVSNGTGHTFDELKSTLTNGWGWNPIPVDGYATVNDQKEKTVAGYGLVRFGMDESPLGHFDGNIGVRVVNTKNDAGPIGLTVPSLNNAPSVAACQATATTAGVSATICDPLAQLYTFLGGSSVTIAGLPTTKNSYTDVLPSLNLRFFLQNNMFLRFAAAKAVIRPTFQQMLPVINLSANFQTSGSQAGFPGPSCTLTPPTFVCPGPFRGFAGNPALKPTQSKQFDASWEYYFGNAGQLSAAVFYKDIKDYIFAGVTPLTVTSNGQDITFQLTQNQNGSHGTVKGFELAYQQFYDFLPRPLDGFGLGANLTYVSSKGGKNTALDITDPNVVSNSQAALPLEGMSKWAYNVFLMYEKYGFSARLAYNWRSHFLLTTSAANINQPVWQRSYGQLDGSIFYDVTKNVKVGVQGTNLLAKQTYLEVGYADRHPLYSSNVTDRRVALVLRGRF
jgi:TonB-dependent receptor